MGIVHPRRFEILQAIFEKNEEIDLAVHSYDFIQRKVLERQHKDDYMEYYFGEKLNQYDSNLHAPSEGKLPIPFVSLESRVAQKKGKKLPLHNGWPSMKPM